MELGRNRRTHSIHNRRYCHEQMDLMLTAAVTRIDRSCVGLRPVENALVRLLRDQDGQRHVLRRQHAMPLPCLCGASHKLYYFANGPIHGSKPSPALLAAETCSAALHEGG